MLSLLPPPSRQASDPAVSTGIDIDALLKITDPWHRSRAAAEQAKALESQVAALLEIRRDAVGELVNTQQEPLSKVATHLGLTKSRIAQLAKAAQHTPADEPAEVSPSDGQLLLQLGLVLQCRAERAGEARLSTLVAHVCHAHCPAVTADERADRLEAVLAEWLNDHRVLRYGQLSPAGLDAWAAGVAPVFLLAAVRACALARVGVLVDEPAAGVVA